MNPADSKIPFPTLTPAMYDIYAPVVFNKILTIIPTQKIANKILENVFLNMYVHKNIPASQLRSPLLSMLDHANEKSNKTIKALKLFRECCGGTNICIAGTEKNGKAAL